MSYHPSLVGLACVAIITANNLVMITAAPLTGTAAVVEIIALTIALVVVEVVAAIMYRP